MKIKSLLIIILILGGMVDIGLAATESSGVQSFDTGLTIFKVRTALGCEVQ